MINDIKTVYNERTTFVIHIFGVCVPVHFVQIHIAEPGRRHSDTARWAHTKKTIINCTSELQPGANGIFEKKKNPRLFQCTRLMYKAMD